MDAFKIAIRAALTGTVSKFTALEQVTANIMQKQHALGTPELSADIAYKMGNAIKKGEGLDAKLEVIYGFSMQGCLGKILCEDLAYDLVDEFFVKKVKSEEQVDVKEEPAPISVKQEKRLRGEGGYPADDDHDDDEVMIVEVDTSFSDARAALKAARAKLMACAAKTAKIEDNVAASASLAQGLDAVAAEAHSIHSSFVVAHSEAVSEQAQACREITDVMETLKAARAKFEASKHPKH